MTGVDLGPALLERLARPAAAEVAGDGVSPAFLDAGDLVALVGALTGGDAAREQAVQAAVRRAVADGLLSSARPCGPGGLAVALARCCAVHGAALRVPFPDEKERVLFDERPGRVVVSLPVANLGPLQAVAQLAGAPLIVLGAVGGERLQIQSALSVPLEELSRAWRAGNPAA